MSTEVKTAGTGANIGRQRPQAVFYQPAEGWVGDVIPFYYDGQFWLYYLQDWRDPSLGTPWYLVRTRDLVLFEEFGEALPSGGADAPDLNAYTGSIIEAAGTFHLFYTGQNPAIVDDADGEPLQTVMHAVSGDLVEWRKVPADAFRAPVDRYERHDWRDPFVYWDGVRERYEMLLAARENQGLGRRRGCIARCTSTDLSDWRVEDPFWSPGLYITHECPELFRMGDHWYLTFSEFSERFVSRYRIGASPDGPWLRPTDDTIDGRAFYAPRTASDGPRRYAFGWIATKEGETDAGPWQWAGSMAIHELSERPDGSLAVSLPESIRESFDPPREPSLSPLVGSWVIDGRATRVNAEGTFALARVGSMDDPYLISASVRFDSGTQACGIALRMGEDPDEAYYIRLEPQRGVMVFDRWPRRAQAGLQWQVDGDVPHAVELERAVVLEAGVTHRLEVVVEGSACVTYLDGSVAMSARMYDRPRGDWGLFVTEGTAVFSGLSTRARRSHMEEDASSHPR